MMKSYATRGPEQLKVVVADDNPDLRRALTGLLARMGHVVVGAAGDGAELLSLCANQPVDLVITDLDMPHVDGLEAAEELSKRGVPVILLSGHADAANVRLEHEPLAARVLKPATQESLQAAIDNARRSRT